MIRVALVDDHPLILEALSRLLAEESDIHILGTFQDGASLFDFLKHESIDVLVLDYTLPDMDGIQSVRQLRHMYPQLALVMLSMISEQKHAVHLFRLGISAFVSKGAGVEQIPNAIRQAAQGYKLISPEIISELRRQEGNNLPHERLSEREFQILLRVARGQTVTEISREIHLARTTVSTYVVRLKRKLGTTTLAELVEYVIRHKLMPPG